MILCAGRYGGREGWKTLDAVHPADFRCSIPPLPDAAKVDLEEVELIHGIGSFYPWQAEYLVREIYDALLPGGKLSLEQPNFDVVCRNKDVTGLFGDPSLTDALHMNRWCYTPATLEELLRSVGFTNIRHYPAQHHNPMRDFRTEAIK